MKMNLCIMNFILIFLVSFFSPQAFCDVYYGVLHGNKIMHFKSPYSGIVKLSDMEEGEIKQNVTLFDVLNYEYNSKILLIEKKLQAECKKNVDFIMTIKRVSIPMSWDIYPKMNYLT